MSEMPPAPLERIEDLQIETELQDSYLTYAMSTIMEYQKLIKFEEVMS